MKERYFVISVKLNKRFFSKKVLFLVEADSDIRCLNIFDLVRNKLPFIDKISPYVYETFDLSNRDEYLDFVSLYQEYTIYLKINHSFSTVFYLTEVYIPISSLIYHELPMSLVHIQTKSAIRKNNDWINKKPIIEREIENSLAFNNLTFSIIEISEFYDWNNTDMWEAIIQSNDIGIIFYESSINDIMKLCNILIRLVGKYGHFLFAYFVDEKRNLYHIMVGDNIEIIPFKREDNLL